MTMGQSWHETEMTMNKTNREGLTEVQHDGGVGGLLRCQRAILRTSDCGLRNEWTIKCVERKAFNAHDQRHDGHIGNTTYSGEQVRQRGD